ncbi:hypothetical protein PSCLAVI8L_180069 [Pseudoclavibacter sp. 8L]|nr:hypothetical protein PSCLAVI8L_180069 [Pseudoclavibacter sp. 8L]
MTHANARPQPRTPAAPHDPARPAPRQMGHFPPIKRLNMGAN